MAATRAMATVTATTWVMAMVTRLAGDKEDKARVRVARGAKQFPLV